MEREGGGGEGWMYIAFTSTYKYTSLAGELYLPGGYISIGSCSEFY